MDRGILRTPIMEEFSGLADKESGRTPQVEEQVKLAYVSVGSLTSVIKELGERLTKAMRSVPPEENEEKDRPEEVLVPLAGDIRSISEHIEVQTDKLRDYLDRLEL